MTDRQEIIINGVDVSGCSALCCGNTCFLSRHYSFTEPKHKQWCSDNPNCHFKQLQRKTEECENARKRILDLEDRIINHSKEIEKYCSRLADRAKECEGLKNQLARYKLYEDMEDFISKHSEDTDEHLSYQLFQTEGKLQAAKQALAPFEDEYFKGLDTKQIAELVKKSIRLTTENRKLEGILDEIKEIVNDFSREGLCFYDDFDCND